jgi:HK97 family phage major capsid protein
MTIDQLIAQVRASVAANLAERDTHRASIETVRAACLADTGRDPSEAEAVSVRAAQEKITALDTARGLLTERVTELVTEKSRDDAAAQLSREFHPAAGAPHYGDSARVTSEPRTYTARADASGTASFFRDAYLSEFKQNRGARERLERHGNEVVAHGEMTERATTTGSFAGLIVPQYLTDQAALLVRAGRPFANTCQKLQIPDQGTQFQIPRGTTGASAAVQATENTSVSSTDEVWANVTVNVATIAGQQDVSRQSIERGTPGIDALIYLDLSGAYGVALDVQVLSGSGSAGQVLGVLNTAGVNQATAFAAAATPTTFYTKTAGELNAVATTRFMAPTVIAMHPRRWYWMVGQVDTTGRPLVVPSTNGPFNAFAVQDGSPDDIGGKQAVGWMQGLPVILDASIPTAVGTGPEDQVIVYRNTDLLLWEDGDGMPKELRFEQTLGNQLTIKLVVYGYIAFTAGRYPTAVGIVGGNAGTAGFGLVAPVF